ncbi:hypothetical protein [Moorena producens]|uniref:hypothetical protein n=1 Tax=Moorena producens TaxID=1155739 RepID=UPI003C725661
MSDRTLEATTQRVAAAVTPQVNQLKEWVKTQPHVHESRVPLVGQRGKRMDVGAFGIRI